MQEIYYWHPVLYSLHDGPDTHPFSRKGQENLLASDHVGHQHHYYTALSKVRVHFYELVRPGSHPAVLQSRATRHDSQHSRPVALWRHSPGQFVHSKIASDNVRSQPNGGNSRMIGKNGCKEAV